MARQRNCIYEKWLYHFFLACRKKVFLHKYIFGTDLKWVHYFCYRHYYYYYKSSIRIRGCVFYFSESAVFEIMIMKFKISFGSPANLLSFLLPEPCVRYKARWATRWMICPYKCKWGRVCGRVSITTPLLWLLLKPTFGNQWTIWKFRRRQTSKY